MLLAAWGSSLCGCGAIPTPAHEAAAPAEPPPIEGGALGPVLTPAELDARRLELARALMDEPGWNLYSTGGDFIATPVDDPLLVEGARRRIDAMRDRLARELPPPAGSQRPAPLLLRIHPDRDAFERAGGQRGTTSFWDAERGEAALFDGGSTEERQRISWPALQHILVHEHLGTTVGLEVVPPWLLFGLASDCEALVLGADGRLAPPAEGRWRALARETAGAAPPPLARFLAFSREEFEGRNEFGSGAYRNLVLAGSLVAFLREEGPANLLGRTLTALQDGEEAPAALRAGLDGTPVAELDGAWRSWIEARTGRPLPAE